MYQLGYGDGYLAAEAMMSLYYAAAQSYRHSSLLKPFPDFILDEGEEDGEESKSAEGKEEDMDIDNRRIEKLREMLHSMPDLKWIHRRLVRLERFPFAHLKLLHWVTLSLT